MSADRIRAVILAAPRTASTFLAECLESHPQVHCATELLNGQPDYPIPPPRGALRYAVKFVRIARTGAWLPHYRLEQYYRRGRAPVRCFKIMYNQLARPFALRYFLDHREIRIIHLRRGNLLHQHVSILLMQKRRDLHTTRPVAPVWIHVDPENAIAAMRKAAASHQRFESLFAQHPRLPVTYEDLFDASRLQVATAKKICDFLGVSRHPMRSKLIKLNPRSLRQMVTNYDELAEAVSRSEFSGLLDSVGQDRQRPAGIRTGN